MPFSHFHHQEQHPVEHHIFVNNNSRNISLVTMLILIMIFESRFKRAPIHFEQHKTFLLTSQQTIVIFHTPFTTALVTITECLGSKMIARTEVIRAVKFTQ